MKKYLVLCCAFMMAAVSSFAQVSINYGAGRGKVSFLNTNLYPKLEDPVPYGPLSFRVADGKFYVADSIYGKIVVLNNKGKILSEIPVCKSIPAKMPENHGAPSLYTLIEDICPVKGPYGSVEGFWAADSISNKVIKLNKKGKVVAEVSNPSFVQLGRIEQGSQGHLYVSDNGAQKIFVFDKNLSLVGALNWEWSGFAVSGEDWLSRLFFDKESGVSHLITTDTDNKVVRECSVDLGDYLNPELWWVDEVNGEFVMTYLTRANMQPNGFTNSVTLVKVGFDGKVKEKCELPVPITMNRYIEHVDYESIYLGKADYRKAPKGTFEIIPFKGLKPVAN